MHPLQTGVTWAIVLRFWEARCHEDSGAHLLCIARPPYPMPGIHLDLSGALLTGSPPIDAREEATDDSMATGNDLRSAGSMIRA
jgi:hypothetical protein